MKTNTIELETPFLFAQEQLDGALVNTKDGLVNPESLDVKRVVSSGAGVRITLKNTAGDTVVLTSFPIPLEKGDILTIKNMTVSEIKRPVVDVTPPAQPARSSTSEFAARPSRSLF